MDPNQPQGVYQQQPYTQEVVAVNQVVYTNPPQQQVIYTNPQPQVIYQQQPSPQVVYVQPQAQPQQTQSQPSTVIVNNVVQSDTTVNHGCHALLFCCTGGLWLPVWVIACLGLGCERPCG